MKEPESPFSKPIVLPIEDSIDLHAFHPKDIPSVVEEYLDQCGEAGLTEVRIIHGRGTGVQRNIVRNILEKHPRVLAFQDAPAEAGGWGATLVVLKS
jgi:DNA-nicking Smr family endonuclease